MARAPPRDVRDGARAFDARAAEDAAAANLRPVGARALLERIAFAGGDARARHAGNFTEKTLSMMRSI